MVPAAAMGMQPIFALAIGGSCHLSPGQGQLSMESNAAAPQANWDQSEACLSKGSTPSVDACEWLDYPAEAFSLFWDPPPRDPNQIWVRSQMGEGPC